ncbi:hypothetical protein FNV43_RR20586 [Rhamnella rubrinervis]|uniref:BURP domain-containing protein n=1 Tax=Rhamnella rubrinervis TaxID=2594499 RepID=A0A8K0GX58_9ROSA|nr:hypothetical protein FNV43_RR20586 [Rhamnella rubrinervis]
MAPGIFSSWVLMVIFYLLFLMTCQHGKSMREITEADQSQEGNKNSDNNNINIRHVVEHSSSFPNHHHHHPYGSNMMIDHSNASKQGFFRIDDLYVGKTLPMEFPIVDPSSPTLAHFLPRQEAERIPFSSERLPQLLQFFSLSDGSPKAKAVKETLEACESKPLEGEIKLCATSLESMLDFVRVILGVDKHVKPLTSTHVPKNTTSRPVLQNYTFLRVDKHELTSSPSQTRHIVACHRMAYPYAVFYCHSLEDSKLVKILAVGEDGDTVHAVFVCHMNTTAWHSDHFSFGLLGVEHGAPICHFFPANNFAWVVSQ